jgi:hypothetical protein
MKKYKNNRSLIIGGMISTLFAVSISCAGSNNSVQNTNLSKPVVLEKKVSDADLSGTYKLTDVKVCNIVITIKKDKNDYTYTINGAGVKSSGRISVVKDDAVTYLVFTGTKRGGDKAAIEGAYSDKKITIQNYGNSMNQYVCFKSCDVKYLDFALAE